MHDRTWIFLTIPAVDPIVAVPRTCRTSSNFRVGPMSDRLLVGNDIVDLRDRRCPGKSRHLRFVARVFHPWEASRILSADDADGTLWLHWAAKEAAYKVVSKCLGKPPVFEHAAFRVRIDRAPDPTATDQTGFNTVGSVRYQDLQIPFRAAWNSDRIHALAWSGEDPKKPSPSIEITTGEAHIQGAALERDNDSTSTAPFDFLLKERFTLRERRSIHSPPSAHVRLLARSAMSERLGIDERRLEIVCGGQATGRTPPQVFLDRQPDTSDVSMSHHGHRVAWAFAREAATPSPEGSR